MLLRPVGGELKGRIVGQGTGRFFGRRRSVDVVLNRALWRDRRRDWLDGIRLVTACKKQCGGPNPRGAQPPAGGFPS